MQDPEIIEIGKDNSKPIEIKYIFYKSATIGLEVKDNFIETPKKIELIARDYYRELDLIFAIPRDQRRSCGCLYLGKWNDGIYKK